ncbi:MAG TPA: isoprenylcysteine carboxylmethyltransferase family protein [Pseudolabrys sp.]|nr:isoprenylcysteine carboxylmethyltransferase family protein [Pseudolabrys sp.]
MRTFYYSIIPALWLIWLAYWIAASIGAKETQREEGLRSRLTHHVPLILGGILLGWPGIAGPQLEQRFVPLSLMWFWCTVAIIVIGLGFSIVARAWLGGNWSGSVTVKKGHELIRSGPYALVRHPIYTGLLLALIGTALAIGRWRALIALIFFVLGIVRKIRIEERFMSEQFGGTYARYRAQVAALVPFVL